MPILDAGKDPGRTSAQVSRLYAIAREHFVSSDEVAELLSQMGVEDARDLSREQYDDLCDGVLPSMSLPTFGRIVDPHTGDIYEEVA